MGESGKINDIQPFAELARGGTTTVYKAYQKSLDRTVLLKVLHPEHSADQELVRRFDMEAKLAAKVQHPNIVSVFDSGRQEDQMYVLTEFVEGQSLAHLIQRGRLPVKVALYILREVARGLKAVHDKGILHRDIKPSNILIATDGKIKVADFGMASLLENEADSDVRGTMPYMPPELLLGKRPAAASDLFSLGATFLEMLTGRPAFTGETSSALMDAIVHADPLPMLKSVDVSPVVRRLVQMLLKKKPEERYESVDVMLRDLEMVQQKEGRAKSLDLKLFMDDPQAYRDGQKEEPEKEAVTVEVLPPPPPAKEVVVEPEKVEKPAPRVRPTTRKAPPKKAKKNENQRWMRIGIIGVVVVIGIFLANQLVSGGSYLKSGGDAGGRSLGGATPAVTPALPETGTRRIESNQQQQRPARSESEPNEQPAEQPPPVSEETPAQTPPPGEEQDPEAGEQQSETERKEDGGIQRIPMGQIRVVAEPWASVFVGADSMGVTPLTLPIRVGSYWITLRKEHFPDFQTEVEVLQGKETPVEVSLWGLVGQVSVAVVPWAEVYVDGTYVDQTPLDQPLIVSPGTHTLSLKHPALGARDTLIVVQAGEQKALQFNLQR